MPLKDGISKILEPSYYPPKAIEMKKYNKIQRQQTIKKPKKQDLKIIIFFLSFFTFSLSDITSRYMILPLANIAIIRPKYSSIISELLRPEPIRGPDEGHWLEPQT